MKAFLAPHKVHSAMTTGFLQQALNPLLASTPVSREQHFAAATKLFFVFGLIHPYLDGNGHIQRLIFTAAIRQHSELKLRPSWTIHPRPYDVEMATAFEQQVNAAQAVADVLTRVRLRITEANDYPRARLRLGCVAGPALRSRSPTSVTLLLVWSHYPLANIPVSSLEGPLSTDSEQKCPSCEDSFEGSGDAVSFLEGPPVLL